MCAFPGVKLLPMFQPPNRQMINNRISNSNDYVSINLLIFTSLIVYELFIEMFIGDECYLSMLILTTNASMQLLAIYLLSFYV